MQFELESLKLTISATSSKYLCRSCVNVLKKRRGLIEQIHNIESLLKSSHESTSCSTDPCLKRSNPGIDSLAKKSRNDDAPSAASSVNELTKWCFLTANPMLLHSTPVKYVPHLARSEASVLSESPISHRAGNTDNTEVFFNDFKVKWPSKCRERKLSSALESLGKMLLHVLTNHRFC